MRDVKQDPKYNPANSVPFAFAEGDHVVKLAGDYTFTGVVIAVFRKRSGAPRYAVENDDGVIHIFNFAQLVSANRYEEASS